MQLRCQAVVHSKEGAANIKRWAEKFFPLHGFVRVRTGVASAHAPIKRSPSFNCVELTESIGESLRQRASTKKPSAPFPTVRDRGC